MSRKVSRRTLEQQEKSGPNWMIIGGIAAVGIVGLLVLLVVTVMAEPTVAVPTPVLQERVSAITEYCDGNEDRCIIFGDANAPVTLVEVSDYGCPHCYDFNNDSVPTLKQEFVETGLVRWIVMPYALSDQTHRGAVATMCAADQGAELGLDFHEQLFGLQRSGGLNTMDGFLSVARTVGLDMTPFEQCVQAETHSGQVHLNRQAARQAGVSSTPTVFVNDRAISGNIGLEAYRQRINDALAGG